MDAAKPPRKSYQAYYARLDKEYARRKAAGEPHPRITRLTENSPLHDMPPNAVDWYRSAAYAAREADLATGRPLTIEEEVAEFGRFGQDPEWHATYAAEMRVWADAVPAGEGGAGWMAAQRMDKSARVI